MRCQTRLRYVKESTSEEKKKKKKKDFTVKEHASE